MTIAYIDPSGAVDDGNPGFGNPYTPAIGGSKGLGVLYASPSIAYGALGGSGHQFLCRGGYFHDRTGNVMFSSYITKSNCIFGRYGPASAAKPVLDCHIYQEPSAANDALWTHSGNGVWYIELAGANNAIRAFRTGVGRSGLSLTSRSLGTYWNPAASVGDLGPIKTGLTQSIWFGASSGPWRLTVYTGSTTVAPPTFYNGIAISQSGSGVANALGCRNGAANNLFQDLEVRGSAVFAVGTNGMTTGGITNIHYRRVDVIACNKGQVLFSSDGASGYIARGCSYTYGLIDNKVSNIESQDTPTVDFQNDDPLQIVDACEGIVLSNNIVRCGTVHTIVNLSPNVGKTQLPRHIAITDNDLEMNSLAIDGRALGIDNSIGVIFARNKIRGTCTKAQLHGSDVYVIGNDFGPLAYNSDPSNQRFLLELSNFPGDFSALNRVIAHNIFRTQGSPIEKAAIGINTYVTALGAVQLNSITIANNLAILDVQDGFVCFAPYNAAATGTYPAGSLTLSSAAVGAGRTINSPSAVFAAGDVGKTLFSGIGSATVTGFTDANNITVTIVTAFSGTSIASGAWSLSIPTSIFFQQILNNYVTRPDGAAALALTGNGSGFIQTDSFAATQPLNGFMSASGNVGATLALANLTPANKPNPTSPLRRAGVHSLARTDAAAKAYTFGYCRDITGRTFYNPPTIGAYEID